MESININKLDLLKKVQENQIKHDNIFAAAVSGYWAKAEEVLNAKLEKVKKQEKIDNYLGLTYPENHADDYSRVISMIELSQDDILKLSSQEFDCYVRNQWGWRSSFLGTNSFYIAASGYSGPQGSAGTTGSLVF